MTLPMFVQQVQAKFGADAIQSMHVYGSPEKLTFMSSGSFAVDYVIGRPGIPCGRITEIFGPFSSGKSTILATIIANFQRRGGHALIMDGEHSYSPQWVTQLGVNADTLYVGQPSTLQDMFEQTAYACKHIVESGDPAPVLIGIDSLSSFPTKEELGFMDDEKTGKKKEADPSRAIGLHARYVAKGLRVLSDLIWKSKVALVFISQLKDNPMNPYQNSKIGGAAVDFHAVLQLKTSKMGKDEKSISVRLRCEKNKVAFPFRETQFDINFGQGIDDTYTFMKVGIEKGLIQQQSGGWYTVVATGQRGRAADILQYVARDIYFATFPELAPPPPPPVEVVAPPSDTEVPTETVVPTEIAQPSAEGTA
jgi:recombination protein RecA